MSGESSDFERRERRVREFCFRVQADPMAQKVLKNVRTLDELLEFSRSLGEPLDASDIVLFYRELNQDFFPWRAMPMQKRREFVHEGRFLDDYM